MLMLMLMLNAHVQACAFAHVRFHSLSFDDCVEQGGPDCDPKKMWLQVSIGLFTITSVQYH